MLYNHVISDIRHLNAKHKNNTVNKWAIPPPPH
jgi:hypothetical protein